MSVLSTNIAKLSSTLKQRGNNVLNTFYPFTMGDNSQVPIEGSGQVLNITDTSNKVNYTVVKDAIDQSKLKISAYNIDGETLYDAANDTFTDISDSAEVAAYWTASNTIDKEDELTDLLEVQMTDAVTGAQSSIQDALQRQIGYGNLELCMATLLEQYRSTSEVSVSKLALLCDEYHQYLDDDVSKLKSDILTSSTGDSVSAFSIINIIKQSLQNIKDSAAANEVELPDDAVYKYETLFDMFTIGNIIEGLGAVLTAVGGVIIKIIGALITITGWLLSQFKRIEKITQATYDGKVDSGYWNFYLYKGALTPDQVTPLQGFEYQPSNSPSSINVLSELRARYGSDVMYAVDFSGGTTYQWYDKNGNVNITGYIYNCFDPEKFITTLLSRKWSNITRDILSDQFYMGGNPYPQRYRMRQRYTYLYSLRDIFENSKMDTATSVVAGGSNYLASLFLSAAYYGLMHLCNKTNQDGVMWYGPSIIRQEYKNNAWSDEQEIYDLDKALLGATPFANALGRILYYFTGDTTNMNYDSVLSSFNSLGYEFISLIDHYRADDMSRYSEVFKSFCFDCHSLEIEEGDTTPSPQYGNKFGIILFIGLVGTYPNNEYRCPALWSIDQGEKSGEDYYDFANGNVSVYITDCYPRKFTYSAPLVTKEALQNFLVTVGVVIAVVATAVIASKIVKFKLRRKLEYSGGKNLASVKEKWEAGEVTDKQFRKSVRKYNKRARLLGIRTYDPINGWFDYPSSSSASDAVSSLTSSWGFGESDNIDNAYDGTVNAPNAATTYQNLSSNLDSTIDLLHQIKRLIKTEEEQ